ncbi:hypothetical protein NP493_1165g00008 [Ridgeia piscesae]|uniref:Uncharacterized protein n=1 Tax=Ridgeia piscesae TaxID=27915 RepID=A0AAD9NHB1_RIDPI|nr:hypothetical protein NP493_1165g00008 [Ridgeia piscesae]
MVIRPNTRGTDLRARQEMLLIENVSEYLVGILNFLQERRWMVKASEREIEDEGRRGEEGGREGRGEERRGEERRGEERRGEEREERRGEERRGEERRGEERRGEERRGEKGRV